jgi:hypothetical protein
MGEVMKAPARSLASLILLAGLPLRAAAPPPRIQEGDAREVGALVEQLDSEDVAQRDRARQELTAKGRKILPLLRPYLKNPSAELANQVRGIVERFEREERLERSLPELRTVTLPKGRHTPEEIFQAIREQTGYRVDAYALRMREPLDIGWEKAPVLRVLDDVCRLLGQGRPEPPPLRTRTVDEFESSFDRSGETSPDRLVVNGELKPPCAVSHFNQFRAALTDVVLTEHRSLKNSSNQAVLSLSVGAQPGTHPIHVGGLEVEEVVDDRGTSLEQNGKRRAVGREGPGPEVGESLDSVWFTIDRESRYGGSGINSVWIQPPPREARRIARLKLKLRLSFAVEERTRVVKIKDIQDKGKEVADFGLATITFSQPGFKESEFSLDYGVTGTAHGDPALGLLDKDGTEIRTGGGGSHSSGAEHHRSWYLRGSTEVAAIRVSAWIGRKTIEIPFEFTDIPLPGAR